MTDLEQAAAEYRQAQAAWEAADAEITVHEANIERLQELTTGYLKRRTDASVALKRAREKLCDAAAPKLTATPETP